MKKSAIPDFQFISGSLALDFVNTVAYRLGRPQERLRSAADFIRWARQAGLLASHDRPHLSPRQLRSLRAVRETLYNIFQPLVLGKAPTAGTIAQLNVRYSRVAPKRQLELHRGAVTWKWKTPPQDSDRVLGPILLNASELFVAGLAGHLHQCADEFCGWIFLDRSQARRRRWCSMADCGNRAKARAHYRHKRRKLAKNTRSKKQSQSKARYRTPLD